MLKEQMKQRENINFDVNEAKPPLAPHSTSDSIHNIQEQNIVVQSTPMSVYNLNDAAKSPTQSLPPVNETTIVSNNNENKIIDMLQKIINTQEKQNILLKN